MEIEVVFPDNNTYALQERLNGRLVDVILKKLWKYFHNVGIGSEQSGD